MSCTRTAALVTFILLLLSAGAVSATTITVDDSGGADYTSIQAAINNASAGDIIEVQSGAYLENVIVNKTLSLKGIGMPLVNASGSGTAITITSGGSTVDGFIVTGSGADWNGGDADSGIKIKSDNNSVLNSTAGFNNYGVYVFESENNTIENNSVYGNIEGVYLFYSSNNSLIGNNLSSNVNRGTCISNSDYNNISSNTALGNFDGTYLITSSNNTIYNNVADSNTNCGIYLYNSDDNIVTNSTSTNSSYGIYLYMSNRNSLSNNIASDTNNGYGIYLLSSISGILTNNIASNNGYGFRVVYSDNSILTNNTLSDNEHGIDLSSSESSVLTNNTASYNSVNGISVDNSDSSTLTNNVVSFNQNGFYFSNSDKCAIINNIASFNSNGYYLNSFSNNMLTKNSVSDNTDYGIYLKLSYSNTLTSNNVSSNKYGIYVISSSSSNTLFKNNFIDNINYNVYDTVGSNSWSYNHYSDYTGSDSDGSGIGDTAYYIAGDVGAKDMAPAMQPWSMSDNSDSGVNFTLYSGDNITLYEGYTLTLQQIDIDGNKAWFTFEKDGIEVDSIIKNVGESFSYTRTIDGTDHLIFQGVLDTVFRGTETELIKITYFYQFSEIDGRVLVGESNDLDNIPLTITLISPSSTSFTEYIRDSRIFIVNVDQVANVTWILDGDTIQTNASVTTASYYNSSAQSGIHNLTVFAENVNWTDQKQWIWRVVMPTPSETVANTVYIRSSIINGSDITNNDMGYIGNNGNGILEINTSNFAGFYYDFNNDIGTEKFEILQNSTVSDRTIKKSGLVYTTSTMDVNYEQTLWTDQYQKIGYFGEEYVPTKSNSANKLSKLLIDEKVTHTLRMGQSFELGEGYAIIPHQIDVDGGKVWLELTKNGSFVSDKIIDVRINTATAKTWSYNQDIGGETDVETFKIYVDAVFQGQVDSLVVIKGIWQISDSILELDTNTIAGSMKVQEIDSKIKMINNESMILSKGSTVDIAKNISIVVADSTTDIRFYLSKGYTTSGIYEVRGEAYNLSSGISGIIDYNNFAGFYYDLNTNIGTESLKISSISGRTIDANSLIYTTVPKVAEFEYTSWGTYNVTGFMGTEYFTGYPDGIFGITGAINLISTGQLSKVLIDEDKSRSIYTGSGLILEEGYVLNVDEIDMNGSTVFVKLTKDGSELDSSIIPSGSDYIYKKDLGSSADVPIIAVHFDNIFQGTETSAVFVDGIFQISDQYNTVNDGDLYGLMEVTTVSVNKIEMRNDNSISLTQDSTISIMDKFKFKVADDSNNVRYYPFTEVIIESIPTESIPIPSVYDGLITEGDGYQINNYVIDVTDVFVSANAAVFKVYDNGILKDDILLGINDSLSFDFEGSTVQLKLRSTISGVLPKASVLIETDYNISDLHANGIVSGGHEYATYTSNTPTESISIGSTTAALSSTVTIPVSLANTENITGISFDLVYNSSVATVSSVGASANFTGASITPNIDNINGSTRVLLTGSDFITLFSETPVLDITFDVIGDFGSSTSLVLQNVAFSDSGFNPYIPDAIVNGSITVGINGDLNNNGYVDIGDVAKVAFMVAGKVPEELSADFNDNGYVDIGDAAKIAFYLAGKVGEL